MSSTSAVSDPKPAKVLGKCAPPSVPANLALVLIPAVGVAHWLGLHLWGDSTSSPIFFLFRLALYASASFVLFGKDLLYMIWWVNFGMAGIDEPPLLINIITTKNESRLQQDNEIEEAVKHRSMDSIVLHRLTQRAYGPICIINGICLVALALGMSSSLLSTYLIDV